MKSLVVAASLLLASGAVAGTRSRHAGAVTASASASSLAASARAATAHSPPSPPSFVAMARASTAGASEDESSVTTELTYEDFLAFSTVKSFLREIDVDWETCSNSTLFTYVPRKVTVRTWPSRVKGSVGDAALGGYVAFDIASTSGATTTQPGSITASYIVITDVYGTLKRVMPTYLDGTQYRALGLKLKNTSTFVMGVGADEDMIGMRALWDWSYEGSEGWSWIADKNTGDAHDIQVSYDGTAFWQPTLSMYSDSSGEKEVDITVANTGDCNHCQLISEDTTAVISSRMTDAILRVGVESGVTQWTLGGSFGDVPLVDLDGTEYDAGTSLWVGQVRGKARRGGGVARTSRARRSRVTNGRTASPLDRRYASLSSGSTRRARVVEQQWRRGATSSSSSGVPPAFSTTQRRDRRRRAPLARSRPRVSSALSRPTSTTPSTSARAST